MATQNIQKTLIDLVVVDQWYNLTYKMPDILRTVKIVHNGVNDDRATDFGLTVKKYQEAVRVDADPDYNINQVGDNEKPVIRGSDIKISFKSDIANGTVYVEEEEIVPVPVFQVDFEEIGE